MLTITITKLYDLVSVKLGKETAENLTTFIEEKIKCEVDTKTSILATKEDVAREIGVTNAKIETSKAELLRWIFVFWIGQMAAMIVLLMKK
jgi:hypothetical protein